MTRPKLVNLLDDFAFGGVSRGLGIFDSEPVRAIVDPSVVAVNGKAIIAPRIDADVIVTHFPPNWRRLIFLASLKARNPSATIIHVEHSYTRAWEANNVSNQRRFRAMLSLATRVVDRIVCVSSAQADWMAEASELDRDAINVIYPYADNPGLEDISCPEFCPSKPLRIGTYGRFHEAKGFDRLIEAYKAGAMPSAELIIGGFGADEDRLKKLAADTPGITFYGKVSDVSAFLSGCDVVAIPSRWESFGQVATEAREAGRPIFVSPIDGLVEQVGSAGKIVDFTSDTAIADAFGNINATQLRAMAQHAKLSTQNAGLARQQDWARLLFNCTSETGQPLNQNFSGGAHAALD
jgi:glycosyltransferase involved in cell wall biosynthesis